MWWYTHNLIISIKLHLLCVLYLLQCRHLTMPQQKRLAYILAKLLHGQCNINEKLKCNVNQVSKTYLHKFAFKKSRLLIPKKLIHTSYSPAGFAKFHKKLNTQWLFTYSESTSPGISDSINSNFDANRSELGPMSTRHACNHDTYSH